MRWMYGEDLKKVFHKAIETQPDVFRRLELHGVQFRPTARCPLSQISRNLEHVHPPGPRAVKIRVVNV
ncbi:hypothetical protein EXIGLDRAFT_728807 [Exidia glandulosa HHB12029]|uniref:Uncharacterized protein n=1 Tax=Exidia glandulosa HHB12029 TaxID=1314781 RepID=A0A165CUZ1_EXIGL|nr:hypothetical protein EXIGLDRAFT_728807 [Exidia glandulosa HHB12029]